MSRILVIQNSCFWNKGGYTRPKAVKKSSLAGGVFVGKEKSGQKEVNYSGVAVVGFILIAVAFLAGALYLYQANSIATQGYEIREIESQIQKSEKEINNLKIREVELKSMYNIEKATENLNLVTASEISYLDIAGPVAMK